MEAAEKKVKMAHSHPISRASELNLLTKSKNALEFVIGFYKIEAAK